MKGKLERLRLGAETSSEVLQIQPRDEEQTVLDKNEIYLLSTYYGSNAFAHSLLSSALSWVSCSHFTGEDTEVQESEVTSSRSHSH